jgi:hypothetical protein
MLYVSLSICAVVCTFFIGRFFAAKMRFVEKNIDAAITRKLSKSPVNLELLHLREQNGVLRNLLIDMLENEGSVAPALTKSPTEQDRVMKGRIQRRREIFGEAVFVLQQAGTAGGPTRNLRVDG